LEHFFFKKKKKKKIKKQKKKKKGKKEKINETGHEENGGLNYTGSGRYPHTERYN